MSNSISALLEPHAETSPAVLAPDRPPLTFAGLRALKEATVRRLNELGIGRGDRVAMVLPNGPEMATAFLTVACAATTAPLNQAYREEELDFYLTDLRARALVVTEAESGPAIAAARRHGARVLRLRVPADAPAGQFELHPEAEGDGQPAAARRRGRPRRHRAGAPHLGHHLAAQDRAAPAPQPRGLGPAYRRCAGADPGRPLPQHHAAVPHPRPDRGGAELGRGRCFRLLHARLQRAALLRLARGRGAHLVHGRADHAPGDPRPCRPQRRGHRAREAPPDPLQLRLAPAPGHARAGSHLRLPGDRVLRHDRGRASDGEQPAPAARPGSPAASASRRARSSAPPTRRAGSCPRASRARSSSPGRTSRPATRATPTPTPRPSSRPRAGAGSAPATRASSTRRATCASPAG